MVITECNKSIQLKCNYNKLLIDHTPPQDGQRISRIPILDNRDEKTGKDNAYVKMSTSWSWGANW